MSSEWEAASLFDLFGDEVVREILALTSVRPCSADELSDHCGASGPTVYRRLESLCDYDLLDESVAYDDDGNHYRTYECRLREVHVGVDDGSLAVDVSLEREVVDGDELEDDGSEN